MDNKEDNWDEFLDGALFALNTNVSASTKYSPYFLMHGRNPRLPHEAEVERDIHQVSSSENGDKYISQYVDNMVKLQENLFPQVLKNIEIAQEKQKIQYRNKRAVSSCWSIKDSDLVLRNMPQKTKMGHKMEDNWLGPYTILDVNRENGSCKLKDKAGKVLKNKISLKQLRPYVPAACTANSSPPSSSSTLDKPSLSNPLADKEPAAKSTSSHSFSSQDEEDEIKKCHLFPQSHLPTEPTAVKEHKTNSASGPSLEDHMQECCNPSHSSAVSSPQADSESESDSDDFKIENDLVEGITEEELEETIKKVVPDLKRIVCGKLNNWRYQLQTLGRCDEYPQLTRRQKNNATILQSTFTRFFWD